MPNRNRTGPDGQGPMTGWGSGICNGNPTIDDAMYNPGRFGRRRGRGYGPGFGRGFGFAEGIGQRAGRRFGAGFGGGYSNVMTLEERKKYLEEELSAVNEQMNQQDKEK